MIFTPAQAVRRTRGIAVAGRGPRPSAWAAQLDPGREHRWCSRRRRSRACRRSAASSSRCSIVRRIDFRADRDTRGARGGHREVEPRRRRLLDLPRQRPADRGDNDRDRARSLGVPAARGHRRAAGVRRSQYVNDFDFNNRAYRVYVQADQRFRAQPADLGQLYVVPERRVRPRQRRPLKEVTAPQVINHFNLFRSAEISGSPRPASARARRSPRWSGSRARCCRRASTSRGPAVARGSEVGIAGGLLFGVSLILVYLVLAAQYESWVLPFIILLACRSPSSARSRRSGCAACRTTSSARSAW